MGVGEYSLSGNNPQNSIWKAPYKYCSILYFRPPPLFSSPIDFSSFPFSFFFSSTDQINSFSFSLADQIFSKTWNVSNLLHQQNSQFLQFYPQKSVNCDIFENGRCFTHLFWVCVQLSTQKQTHSSCFVKTQAWIWQISQKG